MNRSLHTLSKAAITATLVTTALAASQVSARTLSYASVYPVGSQSDRAVNAWADKLAEASAGDLTAKVYPMSLLSGAEISAGVRDGIADVGYLLTVYFPLSIPTST